jgi:hypothetical protein
MTPMPFRTSQRLQDSYNNAEKTKKMLMRVGFEPTPFLCGC